MITQRLVNKFPLWTKARNDPSSMAFRTMSVFADCFDYQYADNKRVHANEQLLKHGLGIGTAYQIYLTEDDLITSTIAQSGEPIYTYPATVLGDAFTVERVDNIDALCWSVPDRFTQLRQVGIDNLAIWEDDRSNTVALTANEIGYPSFLHVTIGPSTDFFKKTPLRNARASGKHLLIIEGKDVNGTPIKEYIPLTDDGHYWTRNVFTEIDQVTPEGFDGEISISIGRAADYIVDPYKLCIMEEGDEGPLRLSITNETTDLGDTARLRYYTTLEQRGENYRDGVVQIETNELEKWEQYLLDDQGDPYAPIDIAINPNSTRLYCLDENGTVHIYEHGPTPFGPPSDQESLTKLTYLEMIPVKHYARLGEEMMLFTRFVRARFPVQRVSVKRISPTGIVRYLQADKTWGASLWEFIGTEVINGLPEDSWGDFAFDSEFDEVGQWEFYTTTKTKVDTTVAWTSVMVDGLNALVSIDTGVSDPLAIWFSGADELMITSGTNGPDAEPLSFYVFQEHSDKYLADPLNQMLFFREAYDEVTVGDEYVQETIALPTGLDELGIHLGFTRLDNESLYNYQRRLILETREPAGPTQQEFIRSISRQVGQFDLPVLRIDLTLDGDGEPLAPDPFIEVTSSHFRAYSDYENGDIDIELNFYDRTNGYFLRDIQIAVAASTFFDVEILDEDYTYKHSSRLRFGNTQIHVPSELLLNSTENKLSNNFITDFYPSNRIAFVNEQSTLGAVTETGDYYVDYTNGVVYSFDVQSAFVSYTYRDFPYTLYHQAVRVYPYLDVDKKYFHNDTLISDTTGEPEYTNLNSEGAEIANTVLAIHPLTWGQ